MTARTRVTLTSADLLTLIAALADYACEADPPDLRAHEDDLYDRLSAALGRAR